MAQTSVRPIDGLPGAGFPSWVDVDHLAQILIRLLRLHRIGSPVERSPTATNRLPSFGSMALREPVWLTARLVKGGALKDGVHIRERAGVLVQRGAVDRLDASVGIDDAHVDEEDSVVAGEVPIQRHVEEARLPAEIHR